MLNSKFTSFGMGRRFSNCFVRCWSTCRKLWIYTCRCRFTNRTNFKLIGLHYCRINIKSISWIVIRWIRRLLPIIILFIVTFLLVLPQVCKSMVYSKYYQSENKTLQLQQLTLKNELRLDAAKLYLSSLDSSGSYFKKSADHLGKVLQGSNPVVHDLAVGILTMSRKDTSTSRSLGFLTQTLTSAIRAFQGKRDKIFDSVRLFICNVDPIAGSHPELSDLGRYVDVYTRFLTTNNTAAVYSKRFEKEKDDYVYCLDLAQKHSWKYVILLQDDVILQDDFVQLIARQIKYLSQSSLNEELRHKEDDSDHWFSIKLYYPEKWSGYAKDLKTVSELLGIALLGGSISVLVYWLYKHMIRRTGAFRTLQTFETVFIFVLGASYFILAVILIGRQHIQSWLRHVTSLHRLAPAPDCCIPAEMYYAPALGGLVGYLRGAQCNESFPVDLAIDQYALDTGLKRFLIEPNICQHIGFVSTLHKKSAQEFLFT